MPVDGDPRCWVPRSVYPDLAGSRGWGGDQSLTERRQEARPTSTEPRRPSPLQAPNTRVTNVLGQHI